MVSLPKLPAPEVVSDQCRETAGEKGLQPWTVEKDFFLTRLIWALAQAHSDQLLLKGGTCLSKCDLGYHRMSEDIDLVIPGQPSRYRGTNSAAVNIVARSLGALGPLAGVELTNFDGERSEQGAHALWELRYPSSFLPPPSSVIVVETSIRPLSRQPRQVCLRQILPPRATPGYEEAFCWALDAGEVRAEKVRAAHAREEIRDFYDLALLAGTGVDMESDDFRQLVDDKLAEVGELPLSQQPASFGLAGDRRARVEAGRTTLAGLLRLDEPPFDLEGVLRHFDRTWDKT